jgi:hypothetical protein
MRLLFTGGSVKAGKHVVPYLWTTGYRVLNIDLMRLNHPGVMDLVANMPDAGHIYSVMRGNAGMDEMKNGQGQRRRIAFSYNDVRDLGQNVDLCLRKTRHGIPGFQRSQWHQFRPSAQFRAFDAVLSECPLDPCRWRKRGTLLKPEDPRCFEIQENHNWRKYLGKNAPKADFFATRKVEIPGDGP